MAILVKMCGWRWREIVAAVLLLLMTAGAAFGQAIKGEIVSVGIGGLEGKGGMYRPGSWVPVEVKLENRSGAQFVGRLGVQQVDLDGDKVISLGPRFVLPVNEVEGRKLWTYFWPRPDDAELRGIKSVIVFRVNNPQAGDSRDEDLRVEAEISTPDKTTAAVGIPVRDDEAIRSSRMVVLLAKHTLGWSGYFRAWGGTEQVRYATVPQADQMPDNVLGLDGVDVIVWEADEIKPSDLAPEFQLKAMLEWVKAGGHLIVSVSTQGQEFAKAGGGAGGGGNLAAAMPISFTGTRELDLKTLSDLQGGIFTGTLDGTFVQAVGTIRLGGAAGGGGRAVSGTSAGAFAEHPLAITGPYGAGTVTVLTFNPNHPGLAKMKDSSWMLFWNRVAGWQSRAGSIFSDAEYQEKMRKNPQETLVNLSPAEIHLGENIPKQVDVTDITLERLLVAVLFLAVYWLLAGPIGHMVMKFYKVVHWSWWIFGGTVLAATGIAGAVVVVLHLTTYDLRYQMVVLGRVNSDTASATGFYGVYAPVSGAIDVKQPEDAQGAGLNYLVPMCVPTFDSVKPFADPQSYQIQDEHPSSVWPVFRNTLKKMQGRWTGALAGLEGHAAYKGNSTDSLDGELTNHSGYDLHEVMIAVHFPSMITPGTSYLYKLADTWKAGEKIDLSTMKNIYKSHTRNGDTEPWLEYILQAMGREQSEKLQHFGGGSIPENDPIYPQALQASQGVPSDVLELLLDDRMPDGLDDNNRAEPLRGLARTMDATKLLRSCGALVIAHAGRIADKDYVKSPVPIEVNGRIVPGKGEILFAWGLSVDGTWGAGPEKPANGDPAAPAKGLGIPLKAAGGILPPLEKP